MKGCEMQHMAVDAIPCSTGVFVPLSTDCICPCKLAPEFTSITEHVGDDCDDNLKDLCTSVSEILPSINNTVASLAIDDHSLECSVTDAEEDEIIECFISCLRRDESHDEAPNLSVRDFDLRGGTGGAHATKKKREMRELIEKMRKALDGEGIAEERKKDLAECLNEFEKVLSGGDEEQTFYQKETPKRDREETSKGKSKGKGKGKAKGGEMLPRFDLARQWPRRDIVPGSWSRHDLRMEKHRRVEFAFADTLSKLKNFRRLLRP